MYRVGYNVTRKELIYRGSRNILRRENPAIFACLCYLKYLSMKDSFTPAGLYVRSKPLGVPRQERKVRQKDNR